MTREEIEGVVIRVISSLSDVGVVVRGRIAQRVALDLAHLSLTGDETDQLRHHIADHSATCGYSCSLIEQLIGGGR